MTDKPTDIEDLFADDLPDDAVKPKRKPNESAPNPPASSSRRKPRAAKIVVEDLSDDELAHLADTETRKTVRATAEAEIARRAEGRTDAAPAKTELIDNAVNIRRLDWECECGNTNTLDLQRCGKCNSHRFTH